METRKIGETRYASLLVILLAVGSLAMTSVPAAGVLAGLWGAPVVASDGEATDIAVDGDSIYVVGFDHLAASHDSGRTWTSAPSEYSKICASDGAIYRASMDIWGYYGATIWFSMSTDEGTTWSASVPVMTLLGRNDGSFGISKFGSRLFVYSLDGSPGTNDQGAMIKVAWSDNLGEKWSKPVLVDERLYVEDPLANDIVCAKGVLYLAYYDQTPGYDNVEVVVARSTSMGKSWESAVVATGPNAHNPVMTVDDSSGELYLSYLSAIVMPDWTLVDAGPYVVRSTDGIAWSSPVKAGAITLATDQSGFHSLAAASGRVFEGYLDYQLLETVGVYDLRISCSMDGGATWADMGDVTGMSTNAVYPMLAISSGELHFVWTDFGTGSPWYDPGTTYHRSMALSTVFGDVTVVRGRGGNPAADAKTMSYVPAKNGWLWTSVVSNQLPVLRVDIYDMTAGKAVLVWNECLVFAASNQGQLDSSMVKVAAGHEYLVKLTPIGMMGASAEVTGLFVPG